MEPSALAVRTLSNDEALKLDAHDAPAGGTKVSRRQAARPDPAPNGQRLDAEAPSDGFDGKVFGIV
jgi:hypothetical protein